MKKTIIAVFPLYNSEVDLKFFTPPPQLSFDSSNSETRLVLTVL